MSQQLRGLGAMGQRVTGVTIRGNGEGRTTLAWAGVWLAGSAAALILGGSLLI
jgi:hypothetical protein